MKRTLLIAIILGQIFVKNFAQYDFNTFTNRFPLLALPIESNHLYNYQFGNPLDNNMADYFVFVNHKSIQNGERPMIIRNGNLIEQYDLGSGNGKFYPIGRINLNPNYITLIAKIYSEGHGLFGLYNFSMNGKCISALPISKYDTGESLKDSVDYKYPLTVNIYNKNNIELYDDNSDWTTYWTLRLRDDGYFEVIKEYIRLRYNPMEICDQTSSNYDANSCARTICDKAHPNYNANSCNALRCNMASPNYDADICASCWCTAGSQNYNAAKCSQACNLTSSYYNCNSCQKQRITQGTALYKEKAANMMSILNQGQPLNAATYYFNNMLPQIYGITYTITYNHSINEIVSVTGVSGGTIQIVIGKGFNASQYYGTLCQELYRAYIKLHHIYNGEYNYSVYYGEALTYAYTIQDCMSDNNPYYPEASPEIINDYYAKMMAAYNAMPEYMRWYIFDLVSDYIQRCRINLDPENVD